MHYRLEAQTSTSSSHWLVRIRDKALLSTRTLAARHLRVLWEVARVREKLGSKETLDKTRTTLVSEKWFLSYPAEVVPGNDDLTQRVGPAGSASSGFVWLSPETNPPCLVQS